MQKQEEENITDIERQGWQAEEIAEQAANQQPDEITRQILRGDETKGNPDERDIAGSVESGKTPQGREEQKQKTGGSQQNG